MKLKLILPIVLVVLVGAGGAYKFVLAKPSGKPAARPKVDGDLLPLDNEFVVNLAGGHYGKVSVTLLLSQPAAMSGGGESGGTPEPVENAPIRAAITDDLTGLQSDDLVSPARRHGVQDQILKDLNRTTDLKVKEVLFTDMVVQ